MSEPKQAGLETRAVRAGLHPERWEGAVQPPLYQASTYELHEIDQIGEGWIYSRLGNPNRNSFEEAVSALEQTRHSMAYPSGVSAVNAVFDLVQPGEHIVCSEHVYGGSWVLLMQEVTRRGVDVSMVDMRDLDAVRAACRPGTRLIWMESPTNPTLEVLDVAALADIARAAGALSAIDNTFATPVLQRPACLGVTLVVHSVTKYLNGHSDVVMGSVSLNDDALYQRMSARQRRVGAVAGPFDCWLALRGLRTLHLRMQTHCRNALTVARALEGAPGVSRVYYPGLPQHPAHDLASRQMGGLYGGVVSVELQDGRPAVDRFFRRTQWFRLAASLGGVESMANYPAALSHANMSAEQRQRTGVTDGLIRLSVGIESVNDLVDDLLHAIAP